MLSTPFPCDNGNTRDISGFGLNHGKIMKNAVRQKEPFENKKCKNDCVSSLIVLQICDIWPKGFFDFKENSQQYCTTRSPGKIQRHKP